MAAQGADATSSAGSSAGRRLWFPMVAVFAALLGVLAGCGGINEQTVGDGDLQFFVHGRELLPRGGTDAEVAGTLMVDEGCILLGQDGDRFLEQAGSHFPVVWPSGTSVEATDPLVIELPSGERLREGDHVRGGGGYPYADTLDIDVPEACLNEWGEVAVFNPDDDPGVVSSGVSPVSAPGLRCDEDVVESPIYDDGEAPPPDGEEPLEAVERFFGDGVPQDAELEVEGLEVHVIQDARGSPSSVCSACLVATWSSRTTPAKA